MKGSRILVTGGTGSFGNRVATTLLSKGAKVRVFSRDEKKQHEMRRKFPEIEYVIGDVRDYDAVTPAMKGVDYVFHAAALKQVPACELFPLEAVKTNILGTANVCRAAEAAGVARLVALSTDKAAGGAINAMGMTKALLEKVVRSFAPQFKTWLSIVRYGNVLGSRGSVVPMFQEQIAARTPLTITDPKMTRFLLTLDDAVELVLYALQQGGGGRTYIKKAPACTVGLLAEACIEHYFGSGTYSTFITGIRPGEKIHETLVAEHELPYCQDAGDFFILHPEGFGKTSPPIAAPYTSNTTEQLTKVSEVVNLLIKAEQATGETL